MKRILTVEDSESIREAIVSTLIEAGFNVEQAVDGADGLVKAKQSQFDIVLSDVSMPKVNGIEFVQSLKELPQYRYVPVLMLTSETAPETKTAARNAGATGWLPKPFDPELLLKTLRRVLD